jgi:putative flippase GtrA
MKLKTLTIRFSKFGVVGAIGYVVDNSIFFSLSRMIENLFALTFIIPLVSYEIAMFNNYVWSFYWVWRDRREKNEYFMRKLLYYNGTTFVPFIFRMLVYVQLFRFLRIDGIFSNMIAIVVGMLFNFFICEKFIFRKGGNENSDNNSNIQ